MVVKWQSSETVAINLTIGEWEQENGMAKNNPPSDRPTPYTNQVSVRLTDETVQELDRVSGGEGHRSSWIRALVERALHTVTEPERA
jgi:hypothetical protein